jgi:hypothetical protein
LNEIAGTVTHADRTSKTIGRQPQYGIHFCWTAGERTLPIVRNRRISIVLLRKNAMSININGTASASELGANEYNEQGEDAPAHKTELATDQSLG